MINSLTSSSPFMFVTNSWPAAPYVNMSNPSAGMMRYNGNSSMVEVYDGTSWLQMSTTTSIETSASANEAITWAMKKMAEERELDKLCEKFPALKKARENFEVIKRLVENDLHAETVS